MFVRITINEFKVFAEKFSFSHMTRGKTIDGLMKYKKRKIKGKTFIYRKDNLFIRLVKFLEFSQFSIYQSVIDISKLIS